MRVEKLIGPAEELFFKWTLCALKRRSRRRQLPAFDRRETRRRQVEERVLADDRVIAFEDVLIERVPPMTEGVGRVLGQPFPPFAAIPGGKGKPPPILDGDKVRILLTIARQDAA